MSLEEKIVSSFEKDSSFDKNSAIAQLRKEALSTFKEFGFPSIKNENWKYTSLKSFAKKNFDIVLNDNSDINKELIDGIVLNIDSYKIVLVNGVLRLDLSDIDSEIELISTDEALENNSEALSIFNKLAPQDESFVAINTMLQKGGFFLNIKKNQIVKKAIQVVNITDSSQVSSMVFPRNIIKVDSNAQVEIVEFQYAHGNNESFINSTSEVFVGENSHYFHYKIQDENDLLNLVDNCFVKQGKYSTATVDTFSFGASLVRNNLKFSLEGEYAVANLNGISLLNKEQHVDNYTFVDHKVPNCDSNELYKGIYDDHSKGVFTGKIYIHKDAQKTNGNQQSNNLVLSENAQINAKPQLEIFADDVKASHGCTVGQLDQEAMFFLRSRGVPKAEAKALLMYAFASQALENIRIDELKVKINKLIAAKLKVQIDF